MSRYDAMFSALGAAGEGALVAFAVLGDPDPTSSLDIVDALVEGGADALELGIPFSDPVADGPVIQRAAARALAAGMTPAGCLELVRAIRARYPTLPIGLLTYANLVVNRSAAAFYATAAGAGADSVLVADLPAEEAESFCSAARSAGVMPVLVLPQDADAGTTSAVARLGGGYTYVLGRRGVTGTGGWAGAPSAALFEALADAGCAPPLIGFGVAEPSQVEDALRAGAAGVIVGSAIVQLIERYEGRERLVQVRDLVRRLKAATRVVGSSTQGRGALEVRRP